MNIIFTVVITITLTWWLLHEYIYSPKAQIKRLWKEIFEISETIAAFKKHEDVAPMDLSEFESQVKKRENVISALLSHHFDQEGDQEYIEGNRP